MKKTAALVLSAAMVFSGMQAGFAPAYAQEVTALSHDTEKEITEASDSGLTVVAADEHTVAVTTKDVSNDESYRSGIEALSLEKGSVDIKTDGDVSGERNGVAAFSVKGWDHDR